MSRRPAPATLGLAALAVTALAPGCSSGGDATVPSVASTTEPVSVPGGTAADLLPEISIDMSRLSNQVVEGDGDREALARINATWAAARPEVSASRPDLVDAFDRTIALATTAVEDRRPADADKAFANLSSLVDDYLGDG